MNEFGIDTTGLFTAAVDHYIAHRQPYPDRLVEALIERFEIGPGTRVIDVGCGPGLLSLPFARTGAEVLGIDPNPAMLDACRRAAEAGGLPVTLSERKAEDLTPEDGPARLVVFGRSFHWTDRDAVARLLDGVVGPGGGVAMLHEHRELKAATPLGCLIEAVKDDWVADGLDKRSPRSHAEVLQASPFSVTDEIFARTRVRWTADGVVGQLLSTSYCNPARLGDQRDAFEADVRARFAGLAPDGVHEQDLPFSAVIGTRPR